MMKELLTARQLQTNNFTIVFQKPITVEDILNFYAPSILTKRFKKKYEKDLKAYIFNFNIQHEQNKWKLRKKISQFVAFQHSIKKKYHLEVPVLPIQKQSQLNSKNVNEFAEFLFVFLKKIVNIAFYDEEVQNFFNILPEKFGQGIIYGENEMKKLSGGRYTEATCSRKFKQIFCGCCRNWRVRSFTVTEHGVFYTQKRKSFEIKEMLNFSHNFMVSVGLDETNFQLGVVIQSAYRELTLRGTNLCEFTLFLSSLKEANKNSPNSDIQRFQSFSPIQQHCSTKYYVDGENYFSDLCDELLSARKYVYIADWMLTPYFLLKRPRDLDDRTSRFDYILENIASKGVKVYIILYQEPEIALNNDSKFVEKYLEEMHKNIKVLRHPKYIVIPFLWSHHQKIVLIDQKVVFMGGLDICYGRWDTSEHKLTNEKDLWKGADFCNLRISDIYSPRNFLVSNLDFKTQPRMPWHDIAVQIRGASVHDIARHFTHYWNFVSFQTRFNERELLHLSGRHSMNFKQISSLKMPKKRVHPINSPKKTNHSISEVIKQAHEEQQIENSKHPVSQLMKIQSDLKSQKTNLVEEGQFYEKYLNEDKVKIFNIELPKIQMPKLDHIKQNLKSYPKKIINYVTFQPQEKDSNDEKLLITNEEPEQSHNAGRHNHQILRSASTWSLGLLQDNFEKSIYNAYLHVIEHAEKYIYIENQFFICKENLIGDTIAKRIIRAHAKKEAFKVIIVVPLLPGFEGHIEDDSSSVMRVQLHWQYWTIKRSKQSLYKKLSHIENVDEYLKFYSLRTHGLSREGLPLTEILYIHSKLIIVDDRTVILGSANINDRSMLGDRDSQIAIIVEDQDLNKNSQGNVVSQSAQKLRVQLYVQHFGVSQQDAEDFMNQKVWDLIKKRAQRNTKIYREVFGCYPDDLMTKFTDISAIQNKCDLTKYMEMKENIEGNVVELPLNFLEEQNLALTPKQKQFYVPDINFT